MINVVCIKWGTKYNFEYVNKLYNMVKRNLTLPFKFICFTDDRTQIIPEVECRDFLIPGMTGWWNKLTLFNKDINLEGDCLFLDLDIVIYNNIDKLIHYTSSDRFNIPRDFGQPDNLYNSSVMKFNVKHHSFIWEEYINKKSIFDKVHGDQNVISTIFLTEKYRTMLVPFQDEWIHSYRWPFRGKPEKYNKENRYNMLPGAMIAVFHGNPKPNQVLDLSDWVKTHWK